MRSDSSEPPPKVSGKDPVGSPLRTAFTRLLGPTILAYLLHMRPLEWPIMSAHFLLGTLLAAGLELPVGLSLLGWFSFVVLMNGATLAINSAFDQDEGDIGYLRNPPKPPRHLLGFSILLHFLGVLCALPFLRVPLSGAWFFGIVLACTVMSILYSVPPARLKARAGWDLLINCLGFGLLTPLAGWALTGRPFTPSILMASLGFAFLFAALYPLTQIYQIEEDRARGDRTLVILLGVPRSLSLAIVATLFAHACFFGALLLQRRALAPVLALTPSLIAWGALLLPWRRNWTCWTPAQCEAGMYWGLAAWALTDLSLLILAWP